MLNIYIKSNLWYIRPVNIIYTTGQTDFQRNRQKENRSTRQRISRCSLNNHYMIKGLIRQGLVSKQESGKIACTIIIRKQHLQIEQSHTTQINSLPKNHQFRIHPRSRSQHKSKSSTKGPSQHSDYFTLTPDTHITTPYKPTVMSKRQSKSTPIKKNKLSLPTKRDLQTSQKGSSFENYIDYIRADPAHNHKILLDFASFRGRTKRNSVSYKQKQALEALENIFYSLYQHLSGQLSQTNRLIEDCCFLFVYSQQKYIIQLLLSSKFPPLLHSRLRPYLFYQRIMIYFLLTLSRARSLQKATPSQVQSFKLMVKYSNDCLQALVEPLLLIEREVVSKMEEAFMLLKAVGEMEKKLAVIQRQMQRARPNKVLAAIEESLLELLEAKTQWTLERFARKEMELSWRFFTVPPVPYLPGKPLKSMTLVIQLSNSLIFYEKATKTLKYRPYVDMFIAKVMSYFEIVLFSCLSYEYTKAIVNQVERIGRYFDFCLCETHMVPQNGKLIKDYGRVGRDEKRMVIVDYVFPTDKRWLKNFIKVQAWEGNKTDRQLEELTHLLEELQVRGGDDVREDLKRLRKETQMIRQEMIQVEQKERSVQ